MAGKGLPKRRASLFVLLILVAGIGYGVLSVASFATAKPTIGILRFHQDKGARPESLEELAA